MTDNPEGKLSPYVILSAASPGAESWTMRGTTLAGGSGEAVHQYTNDMFAAGTLVPGYYVAVAERWWNPTSYQPRVESRLVRGEPLVDDGQFDPEETAADRRAEDEHRDHMETKARGDD